MQPAAAGAFGIAACPFVIGDSEDTAGARD